MVSVEEVKKHGLSKRYLQRISEDTLQELSKEKKSNGSSTALALLAQEVLWERAGRPFSGDTQRYYWDIEDYEDDEDIDTYLDDYDDYDDYEEEDDY